MSAELRLPDEILRLILSHVSDPQTVAALKSIPELKGIAEECCYSRVSSLVFSVNYPRNAYSHGNILTSEVEIDGKAPVELSKNEALMLFLQVQDKANHLRSLKIEAHEGFPVPPGYDTFVAQAIAILRNVSVMYLRHSPSVKKLAVNVDWFCADVNKANFSHQHNWLLIVSIMGKCPNVEILELDGFISLAVMRPTAYGDQNMKLVFDGPSASHLKRVNLTWHRLHYELCVDFEHSMISFSCDLMNQFLSLRERITAFENIKNARITKIFASQQLKNDFLELTDCMKNVSVELQVEVPPPQGAADLQTILKLGCPKWMFEWMGGFLGRAKSLDFTENKLTVELTISLRKGTENALEGLVNTYNDGMQHLFSGEEFPYEYDTSILAHPISIEIVKEGQWIEDLWVVRKGNKVAVLNLKFQFV